MVPAPSALRSVAASAFSDGAVSGAAEGKPVCRIAFRSVCDPLVAGTSRVPKRSLVRGPCDGRCGIRRRVTDPNAPSRLRHNPRARRVRGKGQRHRPFALVRRLAVLTGGLVHLVLRPPAMTRFHYQLDRQAWRMLAVHSAYTAANLFAATFLSIFIC